MLNYILQAKTTILFANLSTCTLISKSSIRFRSPATIKIARKLLENYLIRKTNRKGTGYYNILSCDLVLWWTGTLQPYGSICHNILLLPLCMMGASVQRASTLDCCSEDIAGPWIQYHSKAELKKKKFTWAPWLLQLKMDTRENVLEKWRWQVQYYVTHGVLIDL